MTRRTGVPSLLQVAKRLCSLITTFTPVLTKLYADNEALLAALAAANAACAALEVQLSAVRDVET